MAPEHNARRVLRPALRPLRRRPPPFAALPVVALRLMSTAVLTAKSAGSPLVDRVHSALQSSPYVGLGRLRIEAQEGAIRLQGRVGTFFHKQMAQEIVRRLDGVERVENLLEVSWT